MKKMMRVLPALALVLILALALTACAKDVTLTVDDCGAKTEIQAKTGQTIREILTAAEITLGEKDETDPPLDTELTEDMTAITVKRYAKVTIVRGEEKVEVELVGGKVEDALKAANITLDEAESTDQDAGSYLKNGMTINILKEVKVTLTADGKTEEVSTKAATVQGLLDEKGVTLGENDEISEKPETPLAEGMKIVVKRVEYKEETKTETIDYTTEEQYSDSMASGTSEVTQSGVEGSKEVTYKVKYVDGQEDSREKVSEKVTKEPVKQIVTYGTKQQSSGGGSGSGGKTVVSKIPYYDCDGSGHGYWEITYSDGSKEYPTF